MSYLFSMLVAALPFLQGPVTIQVDVQADASVKGKYAYFVVPHNAKSTNEIVKLPVTNGRVQLKKAILLTPNNFTQPIRIVYSDNAALQRADVYKAKSWYFVPDTAFIAVQLTSEGEVVKGGQVNRYSQLTPRYQRKAHHEIYDKEKADKDIVYMRDYPASPYVPVMLSTLLNFGYVSWQEADEIYKSMDKQLYTMSVSRKVKDNIEMMSHELNVGQQAPAFSIEGMNGQTVSLSDYKGKYVFVDFWASWCYPCRKENPNLLAAYNKIGKEKMEVLSISVDKEPMKWKEAVKKDGMPWTHALSGEGNWTSATAKAYSIRSVPTSYLIGPDGKILAKNLRGKELYSQLTALLPR